MARRAYLSLVLGALCAMQLVKCAPEVEALHRGAGVAATYGKDAGIINWDTAQVQLQPVPHLVFPDGMVTALVYDALTVTYSLLPMDTSTADVIAGRFRLPCHVAAAGNDLWQTFVRNLTHPSVALKAAELLMPHAPERMAALKDAVLQRGAPIKCSFVVDDRLGVPARVEQPRSYTGSRLLQGWLHFPVAGDHAGSHLVLYEEQAGAGGIVQPTRVASVIMYDVNTGSVMVPGMQGISDRNPSFQNRRAIEFWVDA